MTPSEGDRTRLRERRRALTPPERLADIEASRAVTQVLDELGPSSVGLYFTHDGELDPAPVGVMARVAGRTTWYPVSVDESLVYRRWDGSEALEPGRFGIPVPPGHDDVEVPSLDVVIAPLVAFDAACNRAGHGLGFYDRALADAANRPTLIGLAYDFQELEPWEPQPWDVAMDLIITPTRVLRRAR